MSVLAVGLLPVAALLAGAFEGRPFPVETGWGGAAIFYAFWEPLVAWGILAVLVVIARRQDREGRWNGAWASAAAYGAFIVHAPVLVLISVGLAPWSAPVLVKWALAATAATAAAFTLSAGLRRIPGLRRIL